MELAKDIAAQPYAEHPTLGHTEKEDAPAFLSPATRFAVHRHRLSRLRIMDTVKKSPIYSAADMLS